MWITTSVLIFMKCQHRPTVTALYDRHIIVCPVGNSASFTFYNMKESHLHLTKLICCWQSGNDWCFVCSVQMWPPVLLFCAISLCRRLRRQAPAVCDYPVLLTEYDLLHKDAAVPFIIHRFVNTDALRIWNVCRSVVSKLWLKPCQWSEMSFYWFLCKRL